MLNSMDIEKKKTTFLVEQVQATLLVSYRHGPSTSGSRSLHQAYTTCIACFHGTTSCDQKSLMPVWQCHQLPSGFLTNSHLLRVSLQSFLSANDRVDNEVKPWTVHRSSKKSQLGDHAMKAVWPVILPPNDVGKIVQYIKSLQKTYY